MDNYSLFNTAPYPSMTIHELEACIAADHANKAVMIKEVARRAAVKAGDVSQMTPGERLRYAKAKG